MIESVSRRNAERQQTKWMLYRLFMSDLCIGQAQPVSFDEINAVFRLTETTAEFRRHPDDEDPALDLSSNSTQIAIHSNQIR